MKSDNFHKRTELMFSGGAVKFAQIFMENCNEIT